MAATNPANTSRGSGGRPTAADSALIGERIVSAATVLFMRDGYAATSIEAIASLAMVSKRTFYARFDGKGAIFLAVLRDLVRNWLSGFNEACDPAQDLETALLAIARKMLDVALTPPALALHALVTAEVMRFPEIAAAVRQADVDAGVAGVTNLLHQHAPDLPAAHARFAAEQFQTMVVSGPQRRAMGLGEPLSAEERDVWCRSSVSLLLRGLGQIRHDCNQSCGEDAR